MSISVPAALAVGLAVGAKVSRSQRTTGEQRRERPRRRLLLETTIVARLLGARLLIVDGAFYVPDRVLEARARLDGRTLSDARRSLDEGAALLAQARHTAI